MLKHSLIVVAALAAGTAAASAEPTLTVSVYGIAQDSYKKALYAPFEKKCGCTLVVETGNSAERIAKLEARRDAPVIDVAALADYDALAAARKGLIQPIDTAKLGNYGKIYDFAKDPIGGHLAVGYTVYSTSIVYRSDRVKIRSWTDLLNPALEGRVALPNISTTQGPLTLFMLDRAFGGTTPDFATAIGRIAGARNGIVTFYERGAQIPQLLQQDEIDAAVVGRFGWSSIARLKMPVAWASPVEGETGGMNVLTLVKGSKNTELALQFIDYWLSEEVQSKLALDLTDSPTNTDVKVPDAVAENLTYGAGVADLKFLPAAQVLENREAWLAGWNGKIAH